MKTGIRYIATKGSKDQAFQAGDHIILNNDGSISCIEAQGWIVADEVEGAIDGMEFEIDKECIEKRKEYLLNELQALQIAYSHN